VETGFLAEAVDSVALAVSDASDTLDSDGGSDCSRLLLFAAIVAIAQNCCVFVNPGRAPKMLRPRNDIYRTRPTQPIGTR